jgi:DNA-binding transcriptional ArsR family regulator
LAAATAPDDAGFDAALRALAHPNRRRILQLVADRELSPSELAEQCGLTRPAVSQHLRTLRDADLVAVRATGANRLYRARAERIAGLLARLDAFWSTRLGSLQAALADESEEARG